MIIWICFIDVFETFRLWNIECLSEGDGIRFNVIKSYFRSLIISEFLRNSSSVFELCDSLQLCKQIKLCVFFSTDSYLIIGDKYILQYLYMWQSLICLWTKLFCPIKIFLIIWDFLALSLSLLMIIKINCHSRKWMQKIDYFTQLKYQNSLHGCNSPVI